QTSTLSLHDALPIYLDHSRIAPKLLSLLEVDAVFALVRGALIAVVLEAHRRPALGGILKVYLVYYIGAVQPMRCVSGRIRRPGRDRKSTRLNSSHLG